MKEPKSKEAYQLTAIGQVGNVLDVRTMGLRGFWTWDFFKWVPIGLAVASMFELKTLPIHLVTVRVIDPDKFKEL